MRTDGLVEDRCDDTIKELHFSEYHCFNETDLYTGLPQAKRQSLPPFMPNSHRKIRRLAVEKEC